MLIWTRIYPCALLLGRWDEEVVRRSVRRELERGGMTVTISSRGSGRSRDSWSCWPTVLLGQPVGVLSGATRAPRVHLAIEVGGPPLLNKLDEALVVTPSTGAAPGPVERNGPCKPQPA